MKSRKLPNFKKKMSLNAVSLEGHDKPFHIGNYLYFETFVVCQKEFVQMQLAFVTWCGHCRIYCLWDLLVVTLEEACILWSLLLSHYSLPFFNWTVASLHLQSFLHHTFISDGKKIGEKTLWGNLANKVKIKNISSSQFEDLQTYLCLFQEFIALWVIFFPLLFLLLLIPRSSFKV